VVTDPQALFNASGNSASPKRSFLPLWSSATGPFTNLAAGTGLAGTPFEKCAAFDRLNRSLIGSAASARHGSLRGKLPVQILNAQQGEPGLTMPAEE
jgi:hypothetical protein